MTSRTIIPLLLAIPCLALAADFDRNLVRYREILARNPVEGTVLDRLWTDAEKKQATGTLLEQARMAAEKPESSFGDLMVYGLLLGRAGKADAARKSFSDAAQREASSPLPWLALANLEKQNPAKAAAATEEAARRKPTAEIYIQAGNLWLSANDPAKATAAWDAAIALDPGNLAIREQLARSFTANGLDEKAAKQWRAIADGPDAARKVNALKELSALEQRRGHVDEAIQALLDALTLVGPGNWMQESLSRQLIRLHLQYHREAELKQRWEAEAAKDARDLGVRVRLLALYQQTGDTEAELRTLREAAALAPREPAYPERQATLLAQAGDLEQAAKILDTLIQSQPRNFTLVLERAELDIKRNQTSAAESRVEGYLTAHPDQADSQKALAFFKRHHLDEATLRLLKGAAPASPESAAALASFQLEKGNADAALATFRAANRSTDPAAQAAWLSRGASLFSEFDQSALAITLQREAVALVPSNAEAHCQLARMLASAGSPEEAAREMERAALLAPDAGYDEQLFRMLSAVSPRGVKAPASPEDPSWPGAAAAYTDNLTQEALKSDDSPALIRAARWNAWCRRNASARMLADRILKKDPGSIAAREIIASISESPEDRETAAAQLRELMQRNPSSAARYERQLASLAAQSGNLDESITIYQEITARNPGNVDALVELATAEQNAERWFDALATWQKAFAVAPATKKPEILNPLLRAMDRLQLHAKAAELILQSAETETDPARRAALYAELITFSKDHPEILESSRKELEARHHARPDDYPLISALARILKAEGKRAEAYELLTEAAYVAPEERPALEELVNEAVSLGNLTAAIQTQERLIRLSPAEDPSPSILLAALYERNGTPDLAAKVWQRLAQYFPRNAPLLGQAAEFWLRWGRDDTGRDLLRKVRGLDPANLSNLATLAEQTDGPEAIACWEAVITQTKPVANGENILLPPRQSADPALIQSAMVRSAQARGARPNASQIHLMQNFWSDGGGNLSEASKQRLLAIRGISQSLARGNDEAAAQTWNDRWKQGPSQTESLWAAYYSGDVEGVRSVTNRLMNDRPNDASIRAGTIWMLLEMHAYEALADWLTADARTPADRDSFPIAFGQHLLRGTPDPDLVARLFPPKFNRLRSTLWECAQALANTGRLEDAIGLGKRAMGKSTQHRAEYGLQVARWSLIAGNAIEARATLREAIDGEANSFDHPLYNCLRDYYRLLPPDEQKAFVDTYLAETHDAPVHHAISSVLLNGLAGNTDAAKRAIDGLLQRRLLSPGLEDLGESLPGQRYWTFLLTAGIQLDAWHLENLTAYLWDQSVRDTASTQLQGEEAVTAAREIQVRREKLRIEMAAPSEVEAITQAFFDRFGPETTQLFGSLLEADQQTSRALEVYFFLWKMQPANTAFARAVFNTARGRVAPERQLAVLREVAERFTTDPSLRRDILVQTADLLVRRGNVTDALHYLDQGLHGNPDVRAFLEKKADVQQRAGDLEGAVATLESIQQPEPSTQLQIASLLMATGKTEEAIQSLEAAKNPEGSARIAEIVAGQGDIRKATWIGQELVQAGRYDLGARVASAIRVRSEPDAIALLANAVTQCRDNTAAFTLQRKIVEWLPATNPEAGWQQDRLRILSEGSPGLRSVYYDVLCARPQSKEATAKTLQGDFADGTGSISAGVKLVQLYLAGKESAPATQVVHAIVDGGNATEVELAALHAILKARPENAALAALVSEKVANRNRVRDEWQIKYIEDLIQADRKGDAEKRLDSLSLRAVFSAASAGPIAREYVALGLTERAEAMFAEALQADAHQVEENARTGYASLLIREQKLPQARAILQECFRDPGFLQVQPVLEWLKATGKENDPDAEIESFRPGPDQRTTIYAELFLLRAASGAVKQALELAGKHPECIGYRMDSLQALLNLPHGLQNFTETEQVLIPWIPKLQTVEYRERIAGFYSDWGKALRTNGDLQPAIEKYGRATEIDPWDWNTCQELAKLELAQQRPAEAKKVIDRFLKAVPGGPDHDAAATLRASLQE